MTDFARYTVEKFSALDWQGEPCFLPVGGLEVATTPERVAELAAPARVRRAWGVRAPSCSTRPSRCARYPLLDPDVVLGGLFTPTDGIAKAVRAVDAQLARAADTGCDGARPARGARRADRPDGRVTGVRTDQGDLPADIVVCCAGIWGPKVAGDGRP